MLQLIPVHTVNQLSVLTSRPCGTYIFLHILVSRFHHHVITNFSIMGYCMVFQSAAVSGDNIFKSHTLTSGLLLLLF